jgi:AraC family transcriptional activator FtrA
MRATKQPSTSQGRTKHVIAVLVVADTVALEVAVTQQIFGPPMPTLAAVTGDVDSPYEIILCGEEPRFVLPSGTDVGELAPLDAMRDADTIIVPGVQEPLTIRSTAVLAALRNAYEVGARIVSFCGGAFLLGYAGILDSRRATTHWILAKEFREAFPSVRLDTDHLYIDDGPVHTSGGIFSATDLSLHLIALDRGQAYANDTARILVSAPHRPGGQAQFVKESIRTDGEGPVSSFLRWLRDHIDQPLTLTDLARHEHVSERSLVRNFRQATGMSVFDWITRERINQSKVLLETTDFRIGDIAAMVGFGTSETLRRNFEKIAGTTPGRYRDTFQRGAPLPAS